jgi:hypothetical protein
MPAPGLAKPPRWPKGLTTARAAVLASLLAPGEFSTLGMFPAGAVGLHTVMRALVRRYRLPVIRRDFSTESGWSTTWTLAPEVIAASLDAGGREWLSAYRAARSTTIPGQRRART